MSRDHQASLESHLAMGTWGGCSTGKVAPACPAHRRSTPHRENGYCPFSCLPKTTHLSLSYISRVPRVTVPWPALRVSACKHMMPFERLCGFLAASVPPEWAASLLVFTVRCGGCCSSQSQGGAEVPCSSEGNLCTRMSLLMLYRHADVWGQPASHPFPCRQSPRGLFVSLVTELLFSWASDCSPGCLFCNLVVILKWSLEEVSTAFTYCTSPCWISKFKSFVN